MNDKAIIRKLFIAIPELSVDIDFLKTAVSLGLLAQEDLDAAHRLIKNSKKAERFRQKLRNKDIVQRIVVVANELFSVQTVNLLRRTSLVDEKTGHAMRIAARAGKRLSAGQVADETILARGARVFGVLFSGDVVDLVKLLDDEQVKGIANKLRDIAGKKRLSSEEAAYIRGLLLENTMKAERIRGSIKLGRLLAEAFEDARNAKSLVQALAVFGGTVWDHRLVQALARARLITPQQANTLYTMVDLGMDAWRRVAKSFEYSSWAARALMISQGFLTPETITLAKQFGWIDERQARYMYLSANAIRAMIRAKIAEIEDLPGRKYRQIPGKNPIQVFANASKHTDAQILKLIAEASRDSSKAAEKLALQKGFGAKTRAQQEKIVAAKLHEEMRILWENVGHMTIFGEKQAAAAAIDAMDNLHTGLFDGKDIQKMMSAAGRSGVDSYISRQENLRPLSEMVYKNWKLSNGRVDREINKSLLRGQSAKEMADNISRYINPKTPGGVRYAAMRLSRTEINNAFHLSTIRYTREMPWVRGYKWNLSGSHGKPDICNDYADRQNKMGKGVYGKSEIPNKPHPHCLCYVTTEVDKFGDFERGLKSGKYDRYLNQMADEGMPLGTGAGSIRFSNAAVWGATRLGAAAVPLAGIVASQAAPLASKMRGFKLSVPSIEVRRKGSKGIFDKSIFKQAGEDLGFEDMGPKRADEDELGSMLFGEEGLYGGSRSGGIYAFQVINNALRIAGGKLSGKSWNRGMDGFVEGMDYSEYPSLYRREMGLAGFNEKADMRHVISSMDKYFGPSKKDLVVYRRYSDEALKSLSPTVGKTFKENAYSSTELSPRIYNATDRGFKAKIYLPKGSQIQWGNMDMEELIIGRGASFKVVERFREQDSLVDTVELLLIDSPSQKESKWADISKVWSSDNRSSSWWKKLPDWKRAEKMLEDYGWE